MIKTVLVTLMSVAVIVGALLLTRSIVVSFPVQGKSKITDRSEVSLGNTIPPPLTQESVREIAPALPGTLVKNKKEANSAPLPKGNISLNQPVPKKLAFALLSISNPEYASKAQALLENKNIDGVALQVGWASLETDDEIFNWTVLDSVLKIAHDHKKSVTLHIFSGSPAGRPFSGWLKSVGVKTYTLVDFQGRTHEEALPWDQTLLSQYAQFLKSLASHLSNAGYSDTVARISVAVPVSEMDLIACRNNSLANTYPYDRATYLASWEAMIDAHATAFPNIKKFISMPVGLICFPERDYTFFKNIIDYAFKNFGTTFEPFAADLTSVGSDRSLAYQEVISKASVGYQPIWASTSDPSNRMKGTYPNSLLQATCAAVKGGADYVEIYSVDVLNPDATIQKGIEAIHDATLCP